MLVGSRLLRCHLYAASCDVLRVRLASLLRGRVFMCGVGRTVVSPQKFLEGRIVRHARHPAVVVMRDVARAEQQHDGAPERHASHECFQMR